MRELPKTYDAKRVEAHWTPEWERTGIFTAGQRSGAEPYTIMIPPPNVTDVLHMGHALNNTIQDVMARWHRMKGRDVLWLPGTDHAGIATQAVVERKLFRDRGITRHDLGREAFLKEVWAWKEESGGTILQQLRLMGFSCVWTLTAFTMDEKLSRAVRVSFVRMWEKGLIYRGSRMVNWDCVLRSAVGDDEVVDKETQGHLWYMRYPLEDGSGHVTVATTRPRPAARRPQDPDGRRRHRRQGVRDRGGQGDPGPRLRRLRARPAPRPAGRFHHQPGRHAQRERGPVRRPRPDGRAQEGRP
jgi:valyl-tRNA synthetase